METEYAENLRRLLAARLMCLAPHVCKAMFMREPIPVGWKFRVER